MHDVISRQAAIDALSGQISVTGDINAKAVQNYIRMVNQRLHELPSAQPDLSGYSDRLWKAAYERGKAEAQADIIHCGECKYYGDSDGCFFSTATTGADGFCHWAERKEGEAE